MLKKFEYIEKIILNLLEHFQKSAITLKVIFLRIEALEFVLLINFDK